MILVIMDAAYQSVKFIENIKNNISEDEIEDIVLNNGGSSNCAWMLCDPEKLHITFPNNIFSNDEKISSPPRANNTENHDKFISYSSYKLLKISESDQILILNSNDDGTSLSYKDIQDIILSNNITSICIIGDNIEKINNTNKIFHNSGKKVIWSTKNTLIPENIDIKHIDYIVTNIENCPYMFYIKNKNNQITIEEIE